MEVVFLIVTIRSLVFGFIAVGCDRNPSRLALRRF